MHGATMKIIKMYYIWDYHGINMSFDNNMSQQYIADAITWG